MAGTLGSFGSSLATLRAEDAQRRHTGPLAGSAACRDGAGLAHSPRPVDEQEVDIIEAEALQDVVHRRLCSRCALLVGRYLARDKHLAAGQSALPYRRPHLLLVLVYACRVNVTRAGSQGRQDLQQRRGEVASLSGLALMRQAQWVAPSRHAPRLDTRHRPSDTSRIPRGAWRPRERGRSNDRRPSLDARRGFSPAGVLSVPHTFVRDVTDASAAAPGDRRKSARRQERVRRNAGLIGPVRTPAHSNYPYGQPLDPSDSCFDPIAQRCLQAGPCDGWQDPADPRGGFGGARDPLIRRVGVRVCRGRASPASGRRASSRAAGDTRRPVSIASRVPRARPCARRRLRPQYLPLRRSRR